VVPHILQHKQFFAYKLAPDTTSIQHFTQFGSRIARESNRKNFGSNRAANQASAGSVQIHQHMQWANGSTLWVACPLTVYSPWEEADEHVSAMARSPESSFSNGVEALQATRQPFLTNQPWTRFSHTWFGSVELICCMEHHCRLSRTITIHTCYYLLSLSVSGLRLIIYMILVLILIL